MNPVPAPPQDITRVVLVVLCIIGLIGASAVILRPFVGAGIWATTIVVATWPILLGLERRLRGRRWLAAGIMTFLLLLIVALPMATVLGVLVAGAQRLAKWPGFVSGFTVPPPPRALADIPVFGPEITQAWGRWAALSGPELAEQIAPFVGTATSWLLGKAGSAAMALFQLLLTVIIAAVLYARGDVAGRSVVGVGRRLGGERGANAVLLAGRAVRGVALGVVVTAVVQSTLAGIGLFVTGVPLAAPLTGLALVLCVAQVGPGLVLLPAIAWLFHRGDTAWAVVLIVWSIPVLTLDNVLRPILIKKGADLPLLLVFAGVVGGLLSLGMIGIFIGPVVLAVAYTLLTAWTQDATAPAAGGAASADAVDA